MGQSRTAMTRVGCSTGMAHRKEGKPEGRTEKAASREEMYPEEHGFKLQNSGNNRICGITHHEIRWLGSAKCPSQMTYFTEERSCASHMRRAEESCAVPVAGKSASTCNS